MSNYIDAYVFPLQSIHVEAYRQVAEKVAAIWKVHGALSYMEFIGEDMSLEGTISFIDCIESKEDEQLVFGWIEFPSKEIRDETHRKVAADPRMEEIVAPLMIPGKVIFNASRMVFGGFKALVSA